jgi:hypothetical protein
MIEKITNKIHDLFNNQVIPEDFEKGKIPVFKG